MHRGAPGVLRRLRIAEDDVDPLLHVVTVLVVDEDLRVYAVLLEAWPEVVLQELRHRGRREDHALPLAAVAQRLVLDGHAPDVYALLSVRADVLREITRPGRIELGLQRAVVPGVVVLHPRRGRPRRGDDPKPGLGDRHRVPDQGDDVVQVVLDREVLELGVARNLGVRVVAQREVRAVDVSAGQRVVRPARAEVGRDDLLPLLVGELAEHVGRGLGERAAKAQDRLILGRRIEGDDGAVAAVRLRELESRDLGELVAPPRRLDDRGCRVRAARLVRLPVGAAGHGQRQKQECNKYASCHNPHQSRSMSRYSVPSGHAGSFTRMISSSSRERPLVSGRTRTTNTRPMAAKSP